MPRRQVKQSETTAPVSQVQQQQGPQLDISALMASAQDIVKSIISEDNGKVNNMDMGKMLEHVFVGLEKNGNKIDPASKQQMKLMSKVMIGSVMENMESEKDPNIKSKIDLGDEDHEDHEDHKTHEDHEDKIPQKKEIFEELDSGTEVDELRPIAEDLYYKLPVTLEELYTGKTKKLLVSRERLDILECIKWTTALRRSSRP